MGKYVIYILKPVKLMEIYYFSSLHLTTFLIVSRRRLLWSCC